MVNAAVNNNDFLTVKNLSDAGNNKVKPEKTNGSFDNIISKIENASKETKSSDKFESEKSKEIKNLFEQSIKPSAIEKSPTGGEISEEDIVQIAAELMEVVKQIIDVVAQVLEKTPEEVVDSIKELGFSVKDLTQNGKVAELAATLTDNENVTDLLLDPKMPEVLKKITANVDKIIETFIEDKGISREELTGLFTDSEVAEILEPEMTENVKKVYEVNRTEETGYSKTGVASAKVEVAVSEQSISTASTQVKSEIDKHSDNSFEGNSLAQNFSEAIKDVNLEAVTEELDVKPEEIIRQIVDEIRTTVKPDMTSMEMQLNPEHLGRINLQIVSKGGTVTANIMAQNEAVKEAIESQVTQLKETLESQGVKVEAIEVTVGSREFNQNLDENNNGEEQHKQKKHISKEELDEINGVTPINEEDDEELLRAKGSTMSMMA